MKHNQAGQELSMTRTTDDMPTGKGVAYGASWTVTSFWRGLLVRILREDPGWPLLEDHCGA